MPHLVNADLTRPQWAVVKTQWANARTYVQASHKTADIVPPSSHIGDVPRALHRVCSRGVQGSKPQGLDTCPPGLWPRGDPTPAAAGQSTPKSPNTGSKGRIPGCAASAPGAQHSLGLGTRCHSLRFRHLPASGPRLPYLPGAASLRSRHRSLALNLISPGARGTGCFPEAAANSHPAPPACRPHPRGLSAGGLTGCSPARGGRARQPSGTSDWLGLGAHVRVRRDQRVGGDRRGGGCRAARGRLRGVGE